MRHPHFYGHHWIADTQKHRYRHKNRDSSYTGAQVMTKMLFRWRQF